jgi:hypothetical protein
VRARAHHLAEERLFECYVTSRSGDAIDPPSAEHLADCAACAARYAELSAFLETVRTEGTADVDAIFTPERLRTQRQQIVERLEHIGRAARVISFPGHPGTSNVDAPRIRIAAKWLAAAAAAGLFLGVALGASYEWESHVRSVGQVAVLNSSSARASRLAAVGTRGTTPPTIADEDAFISDLEAALERPRTRELAAFDQLTPHVRDVNTTTLIR